MLSLQPPKLKSPQQITKHREADLPRTPYPMPSKGWKRSVSFSEEEDSPQEGEAKKRKTAGYKALLSTPSHLASFPSLDSGYPSASQRHGIPSVELMKAWESILDQVDWSEVMQDAGGRGKPNIYRDVFQTVVQAHVEEQLKQEECREDMIFEHSKRDDEDTDTESGNDSSEDGAGDGFQHFEDNTFVESDESEFGSEDYADDENDDEEDSDDEDQDDDDYEVIDDGVSI
jgi:hypothetical protein